MQNCMTNMKVEAEKTNGKIHVIQNEMNHIKNDQAALRREFEDHEDDKEIHFNEAIAGETNMQKVKRKLPVYGPLAVGGGSGVYLLFEFIRWLVENYQG